MKGKRMLIKDSYGHLYNVTDDEQLERFVTNVTIAPMLPNKYRILHSEIRCLWQLAENLDYPKIKGLGEPDDEIYRIAIQAILQNNFRKKDISLSIDTIGIIVQDGENDLDFSYPFQYIKFVSELGATFGQK